MKISSINLLICVIFATACQKNETMKTVPEPPVAQQKDTTLTIHGDKRIDPYFWLNNPKDPEVISYLNAENEYYHQMTAHTKQFQEDLFGEMKSRIKEDDSSVPYLYNGYYYYTRYEIGKEYPIYSRKKGSLEAPEEVMFNGNEMAIGHSYFKLVGISISTDNQWATFAIDTQGRNIFTLQIKNLVTNEILNDKIEQTTGNVTWANDNKTLFYTRQDELTLRSDKVFRHIIGANPSDDALMYHEKDDTFTVMVMKSKSKKHIMIGINSTLTSEYRFMDANKPNDNFKVFQPRVRGLEYSLAHFENHFYIVTNKDNATNFKVMKTPETKTTQEHWTEVIPHREDTLVEGIEIFKNYLVVEERNNGLNKLKIMPWKGEAYYLPFEIETYSAFVGTNVDFDTDILRFAYQSMATPFSVIDFNMTTKTKEVMKEQAVLGGKFDKKNYEEKRIWATAQDGTNIPISMVWKKGIKQDGKNPLLQYGYGSYGISMDPGFDSALLSLLDRGFIYAIAHIRGGEDLGRPWYEDGKLLNKKNTFTDFIDCSKFLIAEKYTSPEHLFAAGGSAGGLLMGAVINMAPELYKGVIASVPFVDVVTTMLDDSIPLTTGEYDEWGNPNEKEYYQYMKSYSPYDNVSAKEYPNLLVMTGFHDSQVQYWEPAKWVAKLRKLKTDKNILLFHTNMEAGHSGASGRFESLKETAMEYAFLLDLAGVKN
ncbi:MAG: S9 family peptidase [Flavobacterium sp.]